MTSNACVAGEVMVRAMLGLVGVRARDFKVAPPPVPISPFLPPQPPRATNANVNVSTTKMDTNELLTIPGTCQRGPITRVQNKRSCSKLVCGDGRLVRPLYLPDPEPVPGRVSCDASRTFGSGALS